MLSALKLRNQIEADLAERIPAALTPAQRMVREVLECGVERIDATLQGGLPRGAIAELVGPECSGRTTMAMAYVAALTRAGGVNAWIDVADGFDPESAAASGVDLERLLWVRCGGAKKGPVAPLKLGANVGGYLAAAGASQPRHTGGGSPHPRSEGQGMPQAISALLASHNGAAAIPAKRRDKRVGTPGVANRPVTGGTFPYRAEEREEQVNSDRLPARRGENLAVAVRCAEPQMRGAAREGGWAKAVSPVAMEVRGGGVPVRGTWQALDQAIRAVDLLLQSGGFSMIVMDLGSTPAEFAWRIPLATWFRFRAACERTRVTLLLLTQHPCARSSAELVVRMETGSMEADGRVMAGVRYRAEMERQRFVQRTTNVVPFRKPPQAERPGQWMSEAAWARAR